MKYLTAKELSLKWEISERRIVKLCLENRIDGAKKNGMIWLIPEDTKKPSDKRYKVAKYINTKKRVIVINADNKVGECLIPKLLDAGYLVDVVYKDIKFSNSENIWKINFNNKFDIKNLIKNSNKYYDGLVFINYEDDKICNKEMIIKNFADKMNCESSIVLVNHKKINDDIIQNNIVKTQGIEIGLRINTLILDFPLNGNVLINYNSITDDIISILSGLKNSTGMKITTDGGYLKFNNNISEKMYVGKFYKIIDYYFNSLDKNSYLWCASTMLEDEWTEEPLEMLFRVLNLEAANRGVKIDRIFIFSKSKIKEYKSNKMLKIYMQSNINTLYVDLDEISKKEPALLKGVGAGWDGIDNTTLICDLPANDKKRGYININKKDVKDAYNCFKKLMKYSKELKSVLK